MIFEIKVTGARRVGKTTIMKKILDLLEKEASDCVATGPTIEYLQRLKPSLIDGIPAETVIIKIKTFAEQTAYTIMHCKDALSAADYQKEFVEPLKKTT
jgi:molybdopterin-guanine dinucleotide biosynthesis protein